MDLAMMSSAERDGKLIADLAARCRRLRKPKVMSVGRTPATNEAGLFGNRLDVLSVTNPARGWQCQEAFVEDRR
jgi:hypothetical protein